MTTHSKQSEKNRLFVCEENKKGAHHKTAAKYFEEAAKHHRLAAEYMEAGNNAKACEFAVQAQGHQFRAKEAQNLATLYHLFNDQVGK